MRAKLIAWAIASALGYGAYVAYSAWENPLDRISRPVVVDQLPKLPAGCGEECK